MFNPGLHFKNLGLTKIKFLLDLGLKSFVIRAVVFLLDIEELTFYYYILRHVTLYSIMNRGLIALIFYTNRKRGIIKRVRGGGGCEW